MEHKNYLALYKAWNNKFANLADRVIGIWTNGPYSHVEYIVFDENKGYYVMCSALGACNCVRCEKHEFNPLIYDYIEVEVDDPKHIIEFFELIEGSKYDFKGIILSQILPLGMDNPKKWFCSESCTKASQIAAIKNKDLWKVKPESVSPNDLAYRLGLIETDKKVPFYKNLSLLFKHDIPDIYKPFNIKKVNSTPKGALPCG